MDLQSIAISSIMKRYIEDGWEVWVSSMPFRNLDFDFGVYREGEFRRVKVRTTSRRPHNGYTVELRTYGKPFDNSKCDILAVWIKALNGAVFYESAGLKNKNSLKVTVDDIQNRLVQC